MFQDGSHKGIAFEITAYLLKILLHFVVGAVSTESGHGRQREFFLGILIYHLIQSDNSLLPRFHDTDDILCCNRFRIQAVEFLNLMISPCPFIGIIILVHFCKACIDGFQTVDRSFLNTIQQSVDLTLGSNQSGNIHPFAKSDFRIRFQSLTDFFIALEINAFQSFNDGVPQELVNGDFIKTNSVVQRGVLDFSTLVGVNF